MPARSPVDKDGGDTVSSMAFHLLASAAAILSVGVAAQSFQQSVPVYRAPAPLVQPGVSGALAEWRRLRQSDGHSFGEYARFLAANPGWPGEDGLRKSAEARLADYLKPRQWL